MRPLADSTTLVPPQPETVNLGHRWPSLSWLLLLLVLLPLAAVPYLMRNSSAPEFVPIATPIEENVNEIEAEEEGLGEDPEEIALTATAAEDGTETSTPAKTEEVVRKKPRSRARAAQRRATAAAARVQAEPTTFGYVTVGATPFALVRIDGHEVGPTPILNRKVGTGKHVIEFLRPDTGEIRARKVVRVSEHEHRRVTVEE
jgi:hypothetical protein